MERSRFMIFRGQSILTRESWAVILSLVFTSLSAVASVPVLRIVSAAALSLCLPGLALRPALRTYGAAEVQIPLIISVSLGNDLLVLLILWLADIRLSPNTFVITTTIVSVVLLVVGQALSRDTTKAQWSYLRGTRKASPTVVICTVTCSVALMFFVVAIVLSVRSEREALRPHFSQLGLTKVSRTSAKLMLRNLEQKDTTYRIVISGAGGAHDKRIVLAEGKPYVELLSLAPGSRQITVRVFGATTSNLPYLQVRAYFPAGVAG